MGHLAAAPEERCGEVTGMADEDMGNPSVVAEKENSWFPQQSPPGNASTRAVILNLCCFYLVSIILKKDTNVQLKSFLKSTLKPLLYKHVCVLA